MVRLLRLFPALLLAFALTLVVAQELADAEWTLEERCAGEAADPPENWSFPGAILLTGPFGIHAVSQQYDTPFVVTFLRQNDVRGGALSPNGAWYASPYGTILNDPETDVEITLLDEIRVYSTTNQQSVRLPIPLAEFFQEDYGQVHWQDNDHIVYHSPTSGTLRLNILTSEQTSLEAFDDFFTGFNASINFHDAPDWKYALYRGSGMADQQWEIIDLTHPSTAYSVPLTPDSPIAWQADSAGFAAEVQGSFTDDVPRNKLAMVKPNGELTQIIITLQENEHLRASFDRRVQNVIWSPNGRYLAFITTTLNYPTVISLYIADRQARQVYNTCIETSDGLAWSPDGTKLAMMDFYDFKPHRPVMIFDLDTWGLYTVAFHEGSVIGWREG